MTSLNSVSLQHRGGFEKLNLETRAPAGVGFARQTVGVEDIAIEIDRTARRAVDGEAQPLGPLAQRIDRRAAISESGVSSSYCSIAVDAAVDPSAGPRRSTMTVLRPASDSASAINAPDMPAPTMTASHAISRVNGLDEIAGRRRADQIDPPVRRSR